MLRGLSSQSIQQFDRFVTDQVTVHLFAEDPPRGLGTDLIALNIQRGRDHGIPGTSQSTSRPSQTILIHHTLVENKQSTTISRREKGKQKILGDVL